MLISYAQNFEDVILWRALKHIDRGFYIDIGAQDPVVDSVSLAFYEHGWRGVHVEPTASYAVKLRAARPDEEVIEAAIGSAKGKITLFEIPDTGLSTADEAVAARHEAKGWSVQRAEVEVLPLSTLLDRHLERDINWLKIDVEGMEEAVIDGWPPSKARPWVVVVESTIPNSPEQSHMSWEPKLLKLGYDFVYFDGLNRFYVSHEHPELEASFGPGPNVFDDAVLSGLASAPFCRKVNEEAAEVGRRLAAAEAELSARDEALAARDSEIDRLHHHIAAVDQERSAERTRLAAVEAQAARQDEVIAARDSEIDRLHQHVAERDHALVMHRDRIAQLEGEVSALRQSTSWRVTAPMRAVKTTSSWIGAGLDAGANWLLDLPRRLARVVLFRAIVFVQRRPNMKSRLLCGLRRFPTIEAHLRRFAAAGGMTVALPFSRAVAVHTPQNDVAAGIDETSLSYLTPRARAFHRLLVQAIAQSKPEQL